MADTTGDTAERLREVTVGRRGIPLRRNRSVLYTDGEWHAVQEAARLHGKAPRVFVREVSLGMLSSAKPRLTHAPLIRELTVSGTALARLAATARECRALPQAAALEAALAELMGVVRQIAADRSRPRRR